MLEWINIFVCLGFSLECMAGSEIAGLERICPLTLPEIIELVSKVDPPICTPTGSLWDFLSFCFLKYLKILTTWYFKTLSLASPMRLKWYFITGDSQHFFFRFFYWPFAIMGIAQEYALPIFRLSCLSFFSFRVMKVLYIFWLLVLSVLCIKTHQWLGFQPVWILYRSCVLVPKPWAADRFQSVAS